MSGFGRGGGNNPLFEPFYDSLRIAVPLVTQQRQIDAQKERADQAYLMHKQELLQKAEQASKEVEVKTLMEAYKGASEGMVPNDPTSVMRVRATASALENALGKQIFGRDEAGEIVAAPWAKPTKEPAEKGFGSSPLGIYSKETGEISTPSVGKDKQGRLHADKIDLGDKIRVFKSDGSFEDIPKGKIPGDTGMVDKRRVTDERGLRKDFMALPEVKEFRLIDSQIQRLDEAMRENASGGSKIAVDQALIIILNKMLDPQSVVRESEYARTPQDMALWNRIKGKAEKLVSGGAGLEDEDRMAIAKMARNFYNVSKNQYNEQVSYFTDLAKDYGYAPENIVRLGGAKGGTKYSERPAAGTPKYQQEFTDDELKKRLGISK